MMFNKLSLSASIFDLKIIYETQISLLMRVESLEKQLSNTKDLWISISEIARVKNLTKDAVRKQLKNGNFEEGIDFKYVGSKILVNQGAIERIRRQRRNSNG